MTDGRALYEDRFGPFRAVFFRLIIPAGLIGLIPLLLIAGMVMRAMAIAYVSYPVIVVLVAFCGVRSTYFAHGPARWLAAVLGVLLTALAGFLALGFFAASGGV